MIWSLWNLFMVRFYQSQGNCPGSSHYHPLSPAAPRRLSAVGGGSDSSVEPLFDSPDGSPACSRGGTGISTTLSFTLSSFTLSSVLSDTVLFGSIWCK